MDVKLEGLIVAVFAVLPGFISAAVRATIAPTTRATAVAWVTSSVVTSLVLNALILPIFIVSVTPVDLSQAISDLKDSLGDLPVARVLTYLLALYLAAIAWGLASGFFREYAPRVLAYRLRVTPVSPVPNVFNDMLEDLVRTKENLRLRGNPAQTVPWLRVQRKDVALVGRIARGSVDFDVDAPIEVFLSPAFRVADTSLLVAWDCLPGAALRGVYVRLVVGDIVEIFTARADWAPSVGSAHRDRRL